MFKFNNTYNRLDKEIYTCKKIDKSNNNLRIFCQIIQIPLLPIIEILNYIKYRCIKHKAKHYKSENIKVFKTDTKNKLKLNIIANEYFSHIEKYLTQLSKENLIAVIEYAFFGMSYKELTYCSVLCYVNNLLTCELSFGVRDFSTKTHDIMMIIQNTLEHKFLTNDVYYSYRGMGSNDYVCIYRPFIVSYMLNWWHIHNYMKITKDGYSLYRLNTGIVIYNKYCNNDSGSVNVFIHGMGVGVMPYYSFIKRLDEVSKQIILVEIPDISGNAKEGLSTSVIKFCESVYKYLMSMNISKINIICHSFGSLMGASFINMYPETVNKKIMIDSISFMNVLMQVQRRISIKCRRTMKCINQVKNCDKNENDCIDGNYSFKNRASFCFVVDRYLIKDIWLQYYAKKTMVWCSSVIIKNHENMYVIISDKDIYYDPQMQKRNLKNMNIPFKSYECEHGDFVTNDKYVCIIQDEIINLLSN